MKRKRRLTPPAWLGCLCAAFCHNVDQSLAVLLSDKLSDNEVRILGLKDTEAEVAAAYKKNVIMLAEEKFKCGLEKCSKMFKGADFVKKHIQNKHPEIEKTVRNKVRGTAWYRGRRYPWFGLGHR
jgi:hypothetical protein